jgi:hypothetical protein
MKKTAKKNKKTKTDNSSENPKKEMYQETSHQETKTTNISTEDTISMFKPYVPFWGGIIKFKGKVVNITNTCTIDNLLFAFWVASKVNPSFLQQIPLLNNTEAIKSIVAKIDNLEWNDAKELWILNIMKYDEKEKRAISLFGSESNRFLRHIQEYQKHILIQFCSPECNQNGNVIVQENCDKIYLKKIDNKVQIYSGFKSICKNCKRNITCEIFFDNNPNFLFLESINYNILFNELPKIVAIRGIIYKLLCSTIHKNNHFTSIFLINDYIFKIDDLDQSFILLENYQNRRKNNVLNQSTSISFYYMI